MRVFRIALLCGLVLALAVAAFSYAKRHEAERQWGAEIQLLRTTASNPIRPPKLVRLTVGHGTTFSDVLQNSGVDGADAQAMIAAARPVVNFRRLKQGQDLVMVLAGNGSVQSLSYRPDAAEEVHITRDGTGFHASVTEIPVDTEIATVTGTIQSSLFDAVIAAGEHPELAVRLAEIFAWDLDFYTDPRPGDQFRLVFEKHTYKGGDQVEYGKIFAAEYDNGGHPYRAVLFHDRAGRPGYYTADGKSLQKAFLRSPLKFAARISSHFSYHRFHPVLKIYRPHLGTDYAAPVGTPVQAVANGRVEFAGRLGGDGNMVRLAHFRGYSTYYLHLSRILVHRGQAVHQGQIVGLVGATGLATGPHLDFRVRQHGRFINFEHMDLPPATPVPARQMAEFKAVRDKWFGQMSGTVLAQAQPKAPSDNGAQ